MYSLYIPKYEGDRASALALPNELSRFMAETKFQYDLLVSPGYLSKKSGTISNFLTQLEKDLTAPGTRKVGLGLFHGMNGTDSLAGTGTDLLGGHDLALSASARLEKLDLDAKKRKDHRKLIFFLKRGGWKPTWTLDSKSEAAFLDAVTVKAVLIGSSNFSWSTYWNGGNPTPQKGEADLLLFTDDTYMRNVQARIYELLQAPATPGPVLYKSLAGGDSPEAYFKAMLHEFLSHALN